MKSETVLQVTQGAISELFHRYTLHILIFLTALFFIITISNPATFFNDEWITLNQLRQMDNGQQIIFNEGTYGVFKNGTITPYFDVKERFLGYTLMLPVLSWPLLNLFSLFGDNFRFFVVFLWAFLPVLLMIILNQYRPAYAKIWGIPWTWITFVLMAGLFFLNLIFYYPFPFIGDTVPREMAAIVFTQHIFFALLSVVIFSIISIYIKDTWYSLFSLLLCIGCSSYIFWASNAKDHLLTVTFLAIALYFLLRYLRNGNYMDGVSGFIAIGLLSWARPEFALMVFIISVVFIILLNIHIYRKKLFIPFSYHIKNFLLPIATGFGALPFLFNNYYVNKNPFIPTFLVYLTRNEVTHGTSPSLSNSTDISNVDILGMINPLINKIISHFTIKSTNFFGDFISILFAPQNGAMSILAISPLLLIIVIVLLYRMWNRNFQFSKNGSWALFYLFALIIGLPLAYIGNIQGLNTSLGMTPDIRYLSPLYLVVSLFCIFLVYPLLLGLNWKKITAMTAGIIGLGVPINLYMLLLIFTNGGAAPDYIRFYNVFSIITACIAVIFLMLSLRKKTFKEYFGLFLGAIAISPISWQILMTYFFASAKFNGYPFWIPMMEVIYNHLIFVS